MRWGPKAKWIKRIAKLEEFSIPLIVHLMSNKDVKNDEAEKDEIQTPKVDGDGDSENIVDPSPRTLSRNSDHVILTPHVLMTYLLLYHKV